MLGAIWSLFTSTFVWGLLVGLVVGWNFLPQPKFVQKWVGGATKDVQTKVDEVTKKD